MSGPERWRRLRALFALASEVPESERAALLACECGDDTDLRHEVEELLRAAGSEEPFLTDVPVVREGSATEKTPDVAPRVSRFILGERQRSGRIGVVHRARELGSGREVALRLVEAAERDLVAVARLRASGRALESLTHPALVRLVETGIAPRALEDDPLTLYFASEWLDGAVPLLEAVLVRGLDVRRRLDCFHAVCQALSAAHGAGLPHGGLGARNVLLDGAGRPCVGDLGVRVIVGAGASTADAARQDVRDLGALLLALVDDVGDGANHVVRTARSCASAAVSGSADVTLADLAACSR